MDKKKETGTRLFFIEFLIVLFFFLIISTICLQLFAKAHKITDQADFLSRSQAAEASIAALISTGADSPELLADHFPGSIVKGSAIQIFFNQTFECVSEAAAPAYLTLVSFEPHTDTAVLSVYDYPTSEGDTPLSTITFSCYRPMTREEALR